MSKNGENNSGYDNLATGTQRRKVHDDLSVRISPGREEVQKRWPDAGWPIFLNLRALTTVEASPGVSSLPRG